ncbi:MAG: ketol-acid reductoisomerase [Chloroflexi bacterium]|nr:ketol-acid reductoisomerase [Chloroflexota bacterium]
MATIYFDDAGDLNLLKDKVVSILGYGNQGRAQALNMRDSGATVVVGNVRDASFERAVADGFETYDIAGAVQHADYHFLLVPDEVIPAVFDRDIRPHLKPGQAIVVSSGYNVTYGFLRYPADVDVLMIAPRTIGTGVRKTFLDGTGFPSLVSVEHDATGHAQAVMLALAKSMGTLKRCGIESSCEEETLCDLFNEHSGGLYALRRAYEMLVEAGVSPEAAMLEFWVSGESADVAEVMQAHGLFGQLPLHSRTSQYGQQVTGRLKAEEEEAERKRLRKLIAEIKDGTFAKDWTLEQQAGYPILRRVFQQNLSHPMAAEEERLLRLLKLWQGQVGS